MKKLLLLAATIWSSAACAADYHSGYQLEYRYLSSTAGPEAASLSPFSVTLPATSTFTPAQFDHLITAEGEDVGMPMNRNEYQFRVHGFAEVPATAVGKPLRLQISAESIERSQPLEFCVAYAAIEGEPVIAIAGEIHDFLHMGPFKVAGQMSRPVGGTGKVAVDTYFSCIPSRAEYGRTQPDQVKYTVKVFSDGQELTSLHDTDGLRTVGLRQGGLIDVAVRNTSPATEITVEGHDLKQGVRIAYAGMKPALEVGATHGQQFLNGDLGYKGGDAKLAMDGNRVLEEVDIDGVLHVDSNQAGLWWLGAALGVRPTVSQLQPNSYFAAECFLGGVTVSGQHVQLGGIPRPRQDGAEVQLKTGNAMNDPMTPSRVAMGMEGAYVYFSPGDHPIHVHASSCRGAAQLSPLVGIVGQGPSDHMLRAPNAMPIYALPIEAN